MLLVVFLGIMISVIVVLKLVESLDKAVQKEQEAHPKPKKMPFWNKIPSWVITVVLLLTIYLFLAKGLGFIVNQYKVREAKQEAKIQQIEDDYEALDEDNIDEATGKKILTQEFLKKEYKIFYMETEVEDGWMYKIGIIALFLIFGFGIFKTVHFFIGSLYKKYRSTVKPIIFLVIQVVLLIGCIYAFQWFNSIDMPPAPDKVGSIEVYAVTASKDSYEHETEDGTEVEYYVYIDFGDGNGTVTYRKKKLRHLYRTIGEPGRYYLARAKAPGKICDFMCFADDRYISEEEAGA